VIADGVLLLLAVLACTPPPADPASTVLPAPPSVQVQVRRLSLALTGTVPSRAALEAIGEDPAALEAWVDTWVGSEAFVQTVVDAHAAELGLVDDRPEPLPAVGALEGVLLGVVSEATRAAPLERVAAMVREGRPYSDLLAGDSLWVDGTLAPVWGVEHAGAGARWQEARWPDGRPSAGLLTDSSLHVALGGSAVHRAAVLARLLVCDPLDGGHDGDAGQCAGCHAVLDPVAAQLEALEVPSVAGIAEAHVEGCPRGAPCYPLLTWSGEAEVGGAWVGVPVEDLEGLASAVLADPRFARCAVERTWRDLVGTDPSSGELRAMTAVFEASGLDLRALARSIALDGPLREGAPSVPVDAQRRARAVEALTGWRWTVPGDAAWGEVDAVGSHRWGVAGLWTGPSAGWVQRRQAEEAAGAAVAAAAADPSASVLFPDGLPTEPTDAALGHLHAAVLGEVDADLTATRALWEEVAEREDGEVAWAAVVAALLQTLSVR
jgi:hypothetical protein